MDSMANVQGIWVGTVTNNHTKKIQKTNKPNKQTKKHTKKHKETHGHSDTHEYEV